MFGLPNVFIVATVLATAFAARASAQLQAYTFNGANSGNQFGTSVRNAFDVDGDGFDDIIVGEPNANPNGNNSGRARVYSGKTGAILWTFNGAYAGDQFGSAVCGAGDVNSDLRPDLLVAAPFADFGVYQDVGAVFVFSGWDGSLLGYVLGGTPNERLGSSVSNIGDIDHDNHADFIVGYPYWGGSGHPNGGGASIISGATFTPFPQISVIGAAGGILLGWAVAAAGDYDHDGTNDFLVSAPFGGPSNEGEVWVLSGVNAAVLADKLGSVTNGQFGYSIAGSGDVNQDGWPDFVVGAPYDNTNGAASGRVKVFSGLSGSALHNFIGTPGSHFGQSVSLLADVDGDGNDEFLVGSPYGNHNAVQETGIVRVLSGATGNVLHAFYGDSAGDHLGFAVSRGGDMNNDGTPDVIAGAPHAAPNGTNSGLARVWFMGCPSPSTYCTAKINSNGCTPQIDWTGVPTRVTGADDFEITASHVLKVKSGLLFWGTGQLSNPFHGGILCVAAPTVRTPIQDSGCPNCGACQGTYTFAFSHTYMASQSVHAGDTIYAQFWSRDPGFPPPNNYGLTDALKFTVCK